MTTDFKKKAREIVDKHWKKYGEINPYLVELDIATALQEYGDGRVKVALVALKEIQEMFDGEADIDDSGFANRAMKVDVIVEQAILKLKVEPGEKTK